MKRIEISNSHGKKDHVFKGSTMYKTHRNKSNKFKEILENIKHYDVNKIYEDDGKWKHVPFLLKYL